MVGRESECARLLEQLAAVAEGGSRVVIIGGEAGIGKSTLVRYLVHIAQQRQIQDLVGASYDLMAASPYGLWLDLAEHYRRQAPRQDAPSAPHVLTAEGLEQISNHAALVMEIAGFVRALAARRAVLLVIEDAQWADPASLEVLRQLAIHLSASPVLLIVTFRNDELTRQHPFYQHLPALIRESHGLRIELGHLGREDLANLVSLRYQWPAPTRARVVDYLGAHADGNPFFAVELLRTIDEMGVDALAGEYRAAPTLDRFVIPGLVKQVIGGRIDRLGDTMRELLTVAAVIGQDIDMEHWSSLAEIDLATLSGVVERAVESGLLQVMPDDARVRFVHALTRETLYAGTLPLKRRQLHKGIAGILQRQRPHDPDPIAYHLQQAGDPSAPEWLIAAGERAQRAYAWLTARERFAAAADLLADVPGETLTRARLMYRSGRLRRFTDMEGGIADLKIALRLAQAAGDRVLAADAEYSQGLLMCFSDQWGLGVERMASGVVSLESLSPDEARSGWTTVNWMADALPSISLPDADDLDPAAGQLIAKGVNHRRGSLPWFKAEAGHLQEADNIAHTFLASVEGIAAGPLVLSATAHTWFGLGIVHAAAGDAVKSHDAFEQARAIYQRLDHHAVIAFTYLTELIDVAIPLQTDDGEARRQMVKEASRALERAGGALPTDISAGRAELMVLYLDGSWNEIHAADGDGLQRLHYVLRRQITRSLAPVACHRGDFEEAWRLIRAVLPAGVDTQPGSALLNDALALQYLAVTLCLEAGLNREAREWLEANQRWLEWSGSVVGRPWHDLAHAMVVEKEGDLGHATTIAQSALQRAMAPSQPLAEIVVRRVLGDLLLKNGHLVGAREHLARSLDLATRCELPYERACTLMVMAGANMDSPETARALALEARAVLADLDARPCLARLDGLLSRLSGLPRADTLGSGLTPRESEVLHLMADGLTDAQIADQLFISARTVNHHVRSIYDKLDIHSRAAATRFVLEHKHT